MWGCSPEPPQDPVLVCLRVQVVNVSRFWFVLGFRALVGFRVQCVGFWWLGVQGQGLQNRKKSYSEAQGDSVSSLVTPITHIGTLNIPIVNLLTKSPWPSKYPKP